MNEVLMSVSHFHPLVHDVELAALRDGLTPNSWYQVIHSRCVNYVLGYRHYRRLLSVEDGEEIVSQAVFEELSCLQDPRVGAEEASRRVQRALNRGRARYCRAVQRRSRSAPSPPGNEADKLSTMVEEEFTKNINGYLGQALDALRERDRNLLIYHYHLECVGAVPRGAAPLFVSSGAVKIALFRARQRFLGELERLVAAAAAEGRVGEVERTLQALLGRHTAKPRATGAPAPASGRRYEEPISSLA